MVALLDALRELDLLCGGEERHLPDVLEKQLQRVGRDLGLATPLAGLGLLRRGRDDLDVLVLDRGVERVELARIELELVERKGELLGVEPPGGAAAFEQREGLIRAERASRHPARAFRLLRSAQDRPFPSRAWTP